MFFLGNSFSESLKHMISIPLTKALQAVEEAKQKAENYIFSYKNLPDQVDPEKSLKAANFILDQDAGFRDVLNEKGAEALEFNNMPKAMQQKLIDEMLRSPELKGEREEFASLRTSIRDSKIVSVVSFLAMFSGCFFPGLESLGPFLIRLLGGTLVMISLGAWHVSGGRKESLTEKEKQFRESFSESGAHRDVFLQKTSLLRLAWQKFCDLKTTEEFSCELGRLQEKLVRLQYFGIDKVQVANTIASQNMADSYQEIKDFIESRQAGIDDKLKYVDPDQPSFYVDSLERCLAHVENPESPAHSLAFKDARRLYSIVLEQAWHNALLQQHPSIGPQLASLLSEAPPAELSTGAPVDPLRRVSAISGTGVTIGGILPHKPEHSPSNQYVARKNEASEP